MFTQAAGPIPPGQYVMYADDDSPLYFAFVLSIGVVSDTAYFLSDSKYDIKVPN